MLISLMRMFRLGPLVSLNGIADGVADDGRLVGVGALAAVGPAFDVLLGVVPGAAGVGHEDGHAEAAGQRARPAGPSRRPRPAASPATTGVASPSSDGRIISRWAALVLMATGRGVVGLLGASP